MDNSTFRECSNLKYVRIKHVESIGMLTFSGCNALKAVSIDVVTPPSLTEYQMFVNSPNSRVYVPLLSVEDYKLASGWSTHASKIFAIGGSEYQAAAQAAAEEEGVDVSGMDLSDENIFEYIYTHLPE